MNKLTLLGTAQSIFPVDFKEKDMEFWGTGTVFSRSIKGIKKLDLGFEIHNGETMYKITQERDIDYSIYKCPIMVQNAEDEWTKKIIKNPVTFPLQEVIKYAGVKFFTSTFCYMFVYAAMMGYKDIKFSKILLCSGGEYFLERPGLEYWIEKLTQRENLTVHWDEDCELFGNEILYGYEQRPNIYKLRSYQKHLWSRLHEEFHAIENHTASINKNIGAVECYNLLKSQKLDDVKLKEMMENTKKIVKDQMKQAGEHKEKYLQFFGALQQSEYEDGRGF